MTGDHMGGSEFCEAPSALEAAKARIDAFCADTRRLGGVPGAGLNGNYLGAKVV